jgi:hypothetical protein
MIHYSKHQIDYYTSTMDFDEALSMKVGVDEELYHWKKMRHFKIGNIILVRDRNNGIDYLIQLTEDGRKMTEEEKNSAGEWVSQKYIAKFKIIAKDDKPSISKTRYIPSATKERILEKYDNRCQGSNKIMGGTLREKLPKFSCDINFEDGEHKPEFDHVKEFSAKGGLTIEENLLPLCDGCHAMKTAFFTRDITNQLAMAKYSPNVVG